MGTPNAGVDGVSGSFVVESGDSTAGNSGTITLKTDAATEGSAGKVDMCIGEGTTSGGTVTIASIARLLFRSLRGARAHVASASATASSAV